MIYDTPAAAIRRLQEIGVRVEALQRAVAAGHAQRISCTPNDAPQIPGTYAWGFTLRTLREELCTGGVWRKADPGNFSLIINDKRRVNVVVESGDAFTRMAHASPRTKGLKGLYMEAVALRNRVDGDLFPSSLDEELRRVATIIEYPTYVFLIYTSETEYRAELSLPEDVKGNQIVRWKERIFVPDTEEPFGEKHFIPREDEGSDFDIPVRRKA